MQQRRLELAVGAFMLLAIAALSFLALQVSGLTFRTLGDDTYMLSAQFTNVGGLSPRAKVSISGVTVGHVTSIGIDPVTVQAVVDMAIDSDVDYISKDSIAAIKTSGILGEQYISIAVGGAPETLEDGGRIRDTQSAMVLEDLIGRFVTGMGD